MLRAKPDPLDIPKFLLRHDPKVSFRDVLRSRPSAGDVGYVDPRYVFAQPDPAHPRPDWNKPVSMTDAEWSECKRLRDVAASARKSASFAKFKRKLDAKGAVPTDLKGRPLYEPAQPSNTTKSGVIVGGGTAKVRGVVTGRVAAVNPGGLGPASQTVPKRSAGSVDDIGVKVSEQVGTDMTKMKKFAKANGVWKDGDENAKNFGLLRMTVVNRLRGRLKRGEIKQVAWPK